MEAGWDYHVIARPLSEAEGDVAISWYHLSHCTVVINLVPGDCHGPYSPRKDTMEGMPGCVAITALNNISSFKGAKIPGSDEPGIVFAHYTSK